MSNKKIKVVGYAKKEFFGNGIEYRNFSPDLVGMQLASDGGTPLFTMGNFSITTNMEPKSDKNFITNKFSNFISLTDLNLTLDNTNSLLMDNSGVKLNLDKTNLNYYSLFGSLTEFVRVSLEDIITNWPASLYMFPIGQTTAGVNINGYTYENYIYDSIRNVANFKIKTTFINNKFQINYLKNGTILDTFNESNDLRNITVNYSSYVLTYKDVDYPLINFTGSTDQTNDYIYVEVLGNPFSALTINSYTSYHIKPNKEKSDTFYNSLPLFENYLLNRFITPKFTSKFKFATKSDTGIIIYTTESITWPTTDGYNIDFDTTEYVDYATKLLTISNNNDLFSSDLMYRFLVSESISAFDTTPVHLSELDQDTSGQKMTKTLRVYGRVLDDINNYIDGIKFAHTVTYDKLDNTPDIYLKNLARVLGWELVSSVVENDLLSNYINSAPAQYSGETVGLTPVEADVELWRRLILNTPWIWKSKGARKSIEFILNFIGIPKGLVDFNEYIYKASNPINIELFKSALLLNGLENDISTYPIDSDGYPSPFPNTPDMYFQNNGLWYRQTGGDDATIDILSGNNPHLGPYDNGFKYINQFVNLIPNFSAVTVTSQTITTNTTPLFTNYNLGDITSYTGKTYVDATYGNGTSLDDCIVVQSTIIQDPIPTPPTDNCGCPTDEQDDSLSICLTSKSVTELIECKDFIRTPTSTENGWLNFYYFTYDMNNNIMYDINNQPIVNSSIYISQDCCRQANGIPTLYNELDEFGGLYNSGYVCCKPSLKTCGCSVSCNWLANLTPMLLPVYTGTTGPQSSYLTFTRPDGSTAIVTPDGSHCFITTDNTAYLSAIPNMVDPNTGEVGYACKITPLGLSDLNLGVNSVIYNVYKKRKDGLLDCCDRVNQ